MHVSCCILDSSKHNIPQTELPPKPEHSYVLLVLVSGKSRTPVTQAKNTGVIQFTKQNKTLGLSNSLDNLIGSTFQNI